MMNTQQTHSGWRSISPQEAREILEQDPSCALVDVRHPVEYAADHIPGAINVMNETITRRPDELPDPEQTLLIYCRSGVRSKQAAQKLADLGYRDIREFGGIIDWPYETLQHPERGR